MYEKDGEKYFVLDTHTHFWDASPENWVPGAEEYAKGWIECFHAYQGLGPPETHWSIEDFQKYSPERFEKDMFEDGHVDVAIFQPTYLKEWYTKGFNTSEQDAEMAARHPDRLIVNGRWDPRDGDPGLRAARGGPPEVRLQGRQALHGRVERRVARLQARPADLRALLREVHRARHQERPRPQGPDDLAAGQGRLRRRRRRQGRRPATRSSTSSSSTSACRGSRTSASWRRRSATSTPASRSSSAA